MAQIETPRSLTPSSRNREQKSVTRRNELTKRTMEQLDLKPTREGSQSALPVSESNRCALLMSQVTAQG